MSFRGIHAETSKQRDFVLNVQEILRSLYDISHEIPAEAAIASNGVGMDVSIRTNASLQLMLYEVTILVGSSSLPQLLTRFLLGDTIDHPPHYASRGWACAERTEA
jgi:hypothetical protein